MSPKKTNADGTDKPELVRVKLKKKAHVAGCMAAPGAVLNVTKESAVRLVADGVAVMLYFNPRSRKERMNLDRLDAATILGARVWIVTIGQTITGGSGENNKVSDTVLPELPESYANAGDWLPLGKVRTAKPQTDYKTADVEGVDDTGAYKVTELKLAQKRKLQFGTNDITPEAFRMTFGLTETIVDG